MDAATAYRKGWNASKRTTTYDLDAAIDRFTRAHGTELETTFTAGWCEHAADMEYGTALRPVVAPVATLAPRWVQR